VSFAREVRGFTKRYSSGHSDTGCKIFIIPSEHFLRDTWSSICAASLSTSTNVTFSLNILFIDIQKSAKYFLRARYGFYVLIYAESILYVLVYVETNFCLYMRKQIFMCRYDKVHMINILKTHDYFQNIDINVVFLLIFFFLYMQNTVSYLHLTCFGFYVFISMETDFYVLMWESWCDKKFKIHKYMHNIVKYLHNTRYKFYVLIYRETHFYVQIWENLYDKIWKLVNIFKISQH